VPFAIIATGLIAALVLLFILCCKSYKPKGKRPSPCRLVCTSLLAFLCLFAGAGVCLGYADYSYNMLMFHLDHWAPKIKYICNHITILQPMFHNAALWLQDWTSSCVGWDVVKPMISQNLTLTLKNYEETFTNISYQFYSINEMTEPIPEFIDDAQELLSTMVGSRKIVFMLVAFSPTILISVVVSIILIVALCDGWCKNGKAARLGDFLMLKMGALPIVLLMLAVTTFSAALMVPLLTFGSYCAHPAYNTVNMVSATQHGNRTSHVTVVAQYFLEGIGWNQILDTMYTVDSMIEPIKDSMWVVGPGINVMGWFCSNVAHANLESLVNVLVGMLGEVEPLLTRNYVFKQFDTIVIQGLCNEFLSSLVWYVLIELFAALAVLPCIAYHAHRYLSEAAEEYKIEQLAKEDLEQREALMAKTEAERPSRSSWLTCCSRSGGRQVQQVAYSEFEKTIA